MAETWIDPQQSNPGAATLTDLYTVPGGTQFVGRVLVANRSATGTSFRISLAPGAAADALSQYIDYDVPISGNDATQTRIFSLAAGSKVRVYATLATLTFSLVGVQIT